MMRTLMTARTVRTSLTEYDSGTEVDETLTKKDKSCACTDDSGHNGGCIGEDLG